MASNEFCGCGSPEHWRPRSRREFLYVGLVGGIGMTLGQYFGARSAQAGGSVPTDSCWMIPYSNARMPSLSLCFLANRFNSGNRAIEPSSLMISQITAIGRQVDASRPRHMPVETLDLATGYQMAAGAIRGLTQRLKTGAGSSWHFSIARTASILIAQGEVPEEEPVIRLPIDGSFDGRVYSSALGPARRLRFPLEITGNPLFWERPADRAGASNPIWVGA